MTYPLLIILAMGLIFGPKVAGFMILGLLLIITYNTWRS